MIYLSWSIYQLVAFLVALLLYNLIINYKVLPFFFDNDVEELNDMKKNNNYISFCALILLSSFAFDVGNREVVHNRTSYNIETTEIPEKKEVIAPTKDSVYNEYLKSIETKKGDTQ